MDHQVLLINDMAGYGKVALAAMIPVMSHMGIAVCNLPTALVSNTLDYGKFEILDTTGYMENTLKVWEELGFAFEAVSTGFIVNEAQAKLVADYCLRQSQKGVLVFCDPIMGDDGALYNGMGEETVKCMRRMVSCADYAVPNYTEAVFLAGDEYREEPEEADIRCLIDKLRGLGAKSVAITSVNIHGVNQVSCYDAGKQKYFSLPFDCLPVRFPGTGDIFSAVMLGQILNSGDMEQSVKKAMDVVRRMIERNIDNQDKFRGIPVEACLEVIDS